MFVIVDSYTKWVDLSIHKTPTSKDCIASLENCFKTFGFPRTLVSDNGSCFTSSEFEIFCSSRGVKHLMCAAHNPKSNGQAERIVQCAKRVVRKISGTLQARVEKFVTQYRLTPNSTTGKSPNELMLNREVRGQLEILIPERGLQIQNRRAEEPQTRARVEDHQRRSEARYNQRATPREFKTGDEVFYRNFGVGDKWKQGVVTKRRGDVMYELRDKGTTSTSSTGESQSPVVKRHIDQLRKRSGETAGLERDGWILEREAPILPENLRFEDDETPLPRPATPARATATGRPRYRAPLREPYSLRSK